MSPSTVIMLIILVVVCVFSIRSYMKKLSHGCCGAGDAPEKRIRPADKNKAHYPYSATVLIDGMTCAHCVRRVENALNGLTGVWANVSLKENCAHVLFKTEDAEAKIAEAVTRCGYTVKKVEVNAGSAAK